jgi:hypothetical protein
MSDQDEEQRIMTDTKLTQALETGVSADIFYDAHDHGDAEASAEIEDFQKAVGEAVELLKTDTQLIQMLLDVVEDFLPNIGVCALQDYGRLNTAMIEAKARLLRSKEDGE